MVEPWPAVGHDSPSVDAPALSASCQVHLYRPQIRGSESGSVFRTDAKADTSLFSRNYLRIFRYVRTQLDYKPNFHRQTPSSTCISTQLSLCAVRRIWSLCVLPGKMWSFAQLRKYSFSKFAPLSLNKRALLWIDFEMEHWFTMYFWMLQLRVHEAGQLHSAPRSTF